MSSAYKIALSATKKAQEHQKDRYDLKTRGGIVEVGDTVLIKIHCSSMGWKTQTQ